MQPYNLFRSAGRHGLFCAVPEERSVPGFLTSPHWVFSGRIDDRRTGLIGFDPKAAAAGVRFNGFHLFADFQRAR